MTIQRKLYLGSFASAVSVLVVGAFCIHSLAVTAGTLRQTIDTSLQEFKETGMSAMTSVALDVGIDDYVDAIKHHQTGEASVMKGQIADEFTSVADAIRGLRAESDDALKTAGTKEEVRDEQEHIAQIDDLDKVLAEQEANFKSTVASAEVGGTVSDENQLLKNTLSYQLATKALALQEAARTEISDSLNQAAKAVSLQWSIVILVGAATLGLTGTVAVFTAGPLARRLREVAAKAGQLGGGNLTARINIEGKDEISELSRAFNQMAQSLAGSREQLVQAAVRSEAASHAKSTFLANMSHEIRTPMTAIMGYAERLLEKRASFGEHAEALQIIHQSGRHLLDLINDILDISKIEANKMTVDRVEMDLPQLAVDVVSLLRPRAIAQGVALHLEFGELIPCTIRSDPLRVKQVLMNVVGNALKFTERGEVRLKIACRLTDTSSVIEMTVTDTGIGIAKEQLGRLFQPFTQADESTTRRFGGTGLGLTISKHLVQLLGGGLTVDSVAGLGSCFRITIDGGNLAGVEMRNGLKESMLSSSRAQEESATKPTLNCRVLLAEDGPENQKLIRLYLTEAGARVTIASNGRIAVELVDQEEFDLILMDMQMPEMDGYTATRELRIRGCLLPIIALTANAMSDDRAKCLSAGCTGYVTKPIDRTLLLSSIAQVLPRSAQAPAVSMPLRQERLRSTLPDEPKYRQLVQEYVAGLPAQIERLEAALRDADMQALSRELHNLRGTAGGLGFGPLTDRANDLGARVKAEQAVNDVEPDLRRLIDAIRAVDGFGDVNLPAARVSNE